jgi:hypothetical protein
VWKTESAIVVASPRWQPQWYRLWLCTDASTWKRRLWEAPPQKPTRCYALLLLIASLADSMVFE